MSVKMENCQRKPQNKYKNYKIYETCLLYTAMLKQSRPNKRKKDSYSSNESLSTVFRFYVSFVLSEHQRLDEAIVPVDHRSK